MVIVDASIVARTERLLLRPLASSDAQDVLLMRKEAEVMKHTSMLPSPSLAQTQAWIQGCFDSPINWNFAIELLAPEPASPRTPPPPPTTTTAAGPRVIGLIGAVRAPEIGYMLHPSVWGHGYATEALLAFLPLFFAHCDTSPPPSPPPTVSVSHAVPPTSPSPSTNTTVNSITETDTTSPHPSPRRFAYAEAHTDPAHSASHAVLRKAGFKMVERRERDFESPVLGWRDTIVWRVENGDRGDRKR